MRRLSRLARMMLLCCAVVCAACGAAGSRGVAAAPTPPLTAATATPFIPMKPPPPPTTTPVAVNSYPLAAQLWSSAIVARVVLGKFVVEGITPDGQNLTGYAISADGQNYLVGMLNSATRQFIQFEATPTQSFKQLTPPICCVTDGRYFAGFNGVSEGASGNIPWDYDNQTHKMQMIQSHEVLSNYYLGPGELIFNFPEKGGFVMLNLATGATTLIPNIPSQVQVMGFSWPYLAYRQPADTTVTLANLQSGQRVTQSKLGITDYTQGGSDLIGDSLIFALFANFTGSQNLPTNEAMYEADHLQVADAQPTKIVDMISPTAQFVDANARVVVTTLTDNSCGGTPLSKACTYVFAWDRLRQQQVLLTAPQVSGAQQPEAVLLIGNYLMIDDPVTSVETIYDTSKIPTT